MPEAEGERFPFKGQEHIRSEYLQTLDFEGRDQYIRTETEEFVAVCPFSGLPDVARLIIEYYPRGGRCVELKSLKYYLLQFRPVGIFYENIVNRILDDLTAALSPKRMRIVGCFSARGGLSSTVEAVYEK